MRTFCESVAEMCGDEESKEKLRRQISNSWLMEFPCYGMLTMRWWWTEGAPHVRGFPKHSPEMAKGHPTTHSSKNLLPRCLLPEAR